MCPCAKSDRSASVASPARRPRHGERTELSSVLTETGVDHALRRVPLCGSSFSGNVGDGLGKSLRGLLRQIVPNAALDESVLILSREHLRVGAWVGVWCTIRITFKGNGRHLDNRKSGKSLFQIVSTWSGLSKAAALRSNVSSPKSHFGEASCQISFENSYRCLS